MIVGLVLWYRWTKSLCFQHWLSVFTKKSSLKRHFSENPLQFSILETVTALGCRPSLELYQEKQLQISTSGFFSFLSTFNSWNHVNSFMLFQHKRLPKPLQKMSGVLGAAEYLLLLFLPLTEARMPERRLTMALARWEAQYPKEDFRSVLDGTVHWKRKSKVVEENCRFICVLNYFFWETGGGEKKKNQLIHLLGAEKELEGIHQSPRQFGEWQHTSSVRSALFWEAPNGFRGRGCSVMYFVPGSSFGNY